MTRPTYFVGLDVDLAARNLAASIGTRPWRLLAGPAIFADSLAGYADLVAWLRVNGCTPRNTVLCMERSGFPAEPLTYYLATEGYRIAIEPLVKISRIFPSQGRKRDAQYSKRIAEYANCFFDELHMWQPPVHILERVRNLVAQRPLAANPAIETEIRQLFSPAHTLADDWPC